MLPPLVRRTTGLPPPLTGPRRWLRAILPTTVTGRSLLTLPPDVAASRSKAEFSASRTVTPPPDVSSFTSSESGDENVAEMEPPEVEPSTLPATFSIVTPPPLVPTWIGPRKFFTVTEPPEVWPPSVPEPPDTSIPPPLVSTFSPPSQSATRMPPPEVPPSNGPCRRANFSPPPLVFAFVSPVTSFTVIPPPEVLSCASNCAGTVMVYLPSVRCQPFQDQAILFLAREWMVIVLPSCEKLTGRSLRNSSSADLLLRLTFRNTSTTTSLDAFVPTSMDPKSTSTKSLPPGWTAKRLLICSSVSAEAARHPANRNREVSLSFIAMVGL